MNKLFNAIVTFAAKKNFNEEDFNDVEEELKSTLKDIEDECKE